MPRLAHPAAAADAGTADPTLHRRAAHALRLALALFLFTGFLMFFVVSLTVGRVHTSGTDPASRARRTMRSSPRSGRRTRRSSAPPRHWMRRAAPAQFEAQQEALSDAQKELSMTQLAQKWAEAALTVGALPRIRSPRLARLPAPGESGSVARVLADWADNKLDTGSPRTDALIRHALHNRSFISIDSRIRLQVLFMLIPISLPFYG